MTTAMHEADPDVAISGDPAAGRNDRRIGVET
jgi:hypothetical protein